MRKQAMVVTGKRKTAIAKAIFKPGSGIIRINKIPVEVYSPDVARFKIMEPLVLTGDSRKQIDVDVTVEGGGFISQAEAARMSIARGLINWFKTSRVRRILVDYDRSMVAGDSRIKEKKKFGGSGARRKRQKSYR